jgi:hypothetical protein
VKESNYLSYAKWKAINTNTILWTQKSGGFQRGIGRGRGFPFLSGSNCLANPAGKGIAPEVVEI